jgi:CheY-like chemotaxis protein
MRYKNNLPRDDNHKKLLIVDDESSIRKLLFVTLGYGRYQIYFAINGAEALEFAETIQPEVIVLDIRMPGDIDGFEVCRRIKEDLKLKNTYVVLLTGLARDGDREAAMAAHADAYMVKPFSPEKLIELIETNASSC